MLCFVSKQEEEYYEKVANQRLYGVREMESRITERVACEMAGLLKSKGLVLELSSVAQTWIARHKAKDALSQSILHNENT